MQATWHVTVTDTCSVQVTMIGSEGSDCTNRPGTSLSLAPCLSTSWIGAPLDIEHHIAHHTLLTARHLKTAVLKAWDYGHILPIPVHQVWQLKPNQVRVWHRVILGWFWWSGAIPLWFPDVVFLGKTEEDNSSGEETLSLLDISNSESEEVHKAAAARKCARVMSCMPPGETSRFARVTMR